MHARLRLPFCCLAVALASLACPDKLLSQTSAVEPAPARRIKVSEVVASSLITEKTSVKYPDAARTAGIQGLVVLKLIVAKTGDVTDVTAVSGDPLLTQAAAEAVRHWKYTPYIVDGSPVEMETQVSINFHFQTADHYTPPLGSFRDGTYTNEAFDIAYPLPRDWVRETRLVQKRLSVNGRPPGTYVLLAAVHIPQQPALLQADSSFALSAIESANRSCEQYLQAAANDLLSQKLAQQKGTTASFTIAGHDFYRADFDFRDSPTSRAFLCTKSKDYLLQWNIIALSKSAVDLAFSTLDGLRAAKPQTLPSQSPATEPASPPETKPKVVRVRVAQGVTTGLLIKKIQPVYPPEARYAHIQGPVVMDAVIDRNGDVVDLEVLEGQIELVVSAVNAVRRWKYRPYTLNGEPVEVLTEITVNYTLSNK